ncbi:MAG: helix-turn-helix domain-containing protein [Sulfitobacter sp.]
MSHPVDIHVGRRLKQIRNLRRLSQADIAAKLDISFQQIQKYESGANRISASRLFDLAQIFQVEPRYFFDGLMKAEDVAENDDSDMRIIRAIAAIDDTAVQARLLALIENIVSSSQSRVH